MSTSEDQADAGGDRPPRRALGLGLVAVLGLGLVIVGVRLASERESQEQDAPEVPAVAAPADVPEGQAQFSAQGAEPQERRDSPPPAVAPAPIAPLEPSAGEGWREIRGHVVRASDDSPIAAATVVLVPQAGANGAVQELPVQTGRDGGFTVRVPAGPVNFRVTLPESALPRDAARPDARVDGRFEWAGGDPLSDELRIVMESGWRLDVHLAGGDGRPRAGVVVKGGGRSAKSNGDGRCVLLDLPLGSEPVTLTVDLGGGRSQDYPVDAPEPGTLRKDVTLTVP